MKSYKNRKRILVVPFGYQLGGTGGNLGWWKYSLSWSSLEDVGTCTFKFQWALWLRFMYSAVGMLFLNFWKKCLRKEPNQLWSRKPGEQAQWFALARLLIKIQKCTIYNHGAVSEYCYSPGKTSDVTFTAQVSISRVLTIGRHCVKWFFFISLIFSWQNSGGFSTHLPPAFLRWGNQVSDMRRHWLPGQELTKPAFKVRCVSFLVLDVSCYPTLPQKRWFWLVFFKKWIPNISRL